MRNILTATTFLMCFLIFHVVAHSDKIGAIEIGHAWARATTAHAAVASVYVPFLNTGTEPDTLTGADTQRAEMTTLHESSEENGIATMRSIQSLTLAPNKPIALRPGGKHFMLMGLKQPLREGDKFSMTLHFAKAGAIEIQVFVQAPGAHSSPH